MADKKDKKKKEDKKKDDDRKPEKPRKDDKKKDDKKSTPKDDKKTDKKADKPSQGDPVAAAMKQARREATSRVESGDRGSSVEQALAQARRNAGGDGGGGGGEGDGPGGGGLNDVYMGQVMLAVRPNWSFTSATRLNLVCVVRVKVNLQGEVEKSRRDAKLRQRAVRLLGGQRHLAHQPGGGLPAAAVGTVHRAGPCLHPQ